MLVVRLTQLFDSIKQTLFIVGTGLVVFLCLRNSLIWHMQQFWGASGDFWQRQWENMYNFFGQNELLIFVIGSFIYTTAVFWFANIFFIMLDVMGWPSFLLKYKIQSDKNCPLVMADLKKAVKVALFNQTIVGLPFTLAMFFLMRWRGCSVSPDDLPTFQWAVVEMTVFTLIEELCFYYSHRLFHHPRIYKHVHKMHHEWTAPIGIVSIYAHPLEHMISNMLPPSLGPLLMGSHLATAWMFCALALFSTTVSHCGYHLPLLPSPEAHDYHHLKFNQNYGVLGVLDRLHGTDAQFRNSVSFQRHFLLLSSTPVSQQLPERPKQKPE
uniref:Fatty acid hydroxylase domain-containing protein n=1 Tax=Arion vulgaris TaxID=1028688 RepID=A0A0B6YNK3_9EUPU